MLAIEPLIYRRWLHEPGHPEKIHETVFSDRTHLMIEEVAKQWIQNPEVAIVQDTRKWKSPEKIAFLDEARSTGATCEAGYQMYW